MVREQDYIGNHQRAQELNARFANSGNVVAELLAKRREALARKYRYQKKKQQNHAEIPLKEERKFLTELQSKVSRIETLLDLLAKNLSEALANPPLDHSLRLSLGKGSNVIGPVPREYIEIIDNGQDITPIITIPSADILFGSEASLLYGIDDEIGLQGILIELHTPGEKNDACFQLEASGGLGVSFLSDYQLKDLRQPIPA